MHDGRRWSSRWTGGAAAIVAGALVGSLIGALPPSPASAQDDDGLDMVTTTTFTVDPDAAAVHVVVELTLTNTVADHREGETISRAYFTGFRVGLPTSATAVAARSEGRDLAVTLDAGTGDYQAADVELVDDLFAGESADVTVSWELTGSPARADDPSRINAAYRAFLAYGQGDPGQVALRVVVPDRFTVETRGAEVDRVRFGSSWVYSADAIAEPDEFSLFVFARDDAALRSTPVDVGGHDVVVRSWPGDDQWRRFSRRQVVDGIPVFERLTGVEWPISGELSVIEAYTPSLYGYAGWYSARDDEIEVGEELDRTTMLHELSHAWFNDGQFTDRWINEGLAQTYAELAKLDLGGRAEQPSRPGRGDAGRQQLASWGHALSDDPDDDAEDYGYAASWYVVDAIVDEVGTDAMADLFAAADDGEIAYVGDAQPEPDAERFGWRRFLDLLQERAGSERAEGLFDELVVTRAQRRTLADRAAARTAYAGLERDGDGWAPPLGVRTAMADWSFDEAAAQIESAGEVLAARDELAETAARIDLDPASGPEAAYEASGTVAALAGVTADLAATNAAGTRLLDARDAATADRGFYASVGLRDVDLDGLLARAGTAFADGDLATVDRLAGEVTRAVDGADAEGQAIVRGWLVTAATALAGLVAVVVAIVVFRRRARRRQAQVAASVAAADAPADEAGVEARDEADDDVLHRTVSRSP